MPMIIKASFINSIQAKVDWSGGDREEWNAALALIKNTTGAIFNPDGKYWVIHIDNLKPLAVKAEQMGFQFFVSNEDWAYYTRYEASQDSVAELAFKLDVDGWVQPPHLKTEPRGYQKVAITMMRHTLGGIILGDPVGSGKTIECIGDMLYNDRIDLDKLSPNQILFLCPATLKDNILKDFVKHTDIAHLVTVIEGVRKKREEQWASSTPIKIASYQGTLIYDRDIMPKKWNRIYADEFNAVKNYESKANRFIKELDVRDGIVGMTATPIELNLGELYSLYQVIQPGMLGTWAQFSRDHLELDRFGGIKGSRNLIKLSERIAPHQIKRTKAFILPQLPAKVPRTYTFDLSATEMAEYNKIANDFMRWVKENAHRRVTNALKKDQKGNYITESLRMRQFLDCPYLVDPALPIQNSKMEVLKQLIESVDGKIVVFSQWARMIRILNEHFTKLGYKTIMITGEDVDIKDRMPLINQFNSSEDDTKIFFTTDALQRGVDLISADTIIHYDSLWNPAKMIEQREGRLHRMNRDRGSVLAIRLVANNTIEQTVERVLFERADLADSVEGLNETTLKDWGERQWKDAVKGKVID